MTEDPRPPTPQTQPVEKPKPCFVIARPRSGTTVFSKMLQTHPKVLSIGEIFNEENPHSYYNFLQKKILANPDFILPSSANWMFLQYVESCRTLAIERKQQCKIVILDVKYDQAHLLCEPWLRIGKLPRLFFMMREKKWKVIDLHRRDVFKLNVSNMVAIHSSIYHSTALEPGQIQTAKVRIDSTKLEEDIEATHNAYAALTAHFAGRPQYKRIYYEDMFTDESGTSFSPALLDDVAKFLGIRNVFDGSPRLQKLLKDDVFSYIENVAEIRELLFQNSSSDSDTEVTQS
jgi:hypothetical protein